MHFSRWICLYFACVANPPSSLPLQPHLVLLRFPGLQLSQSQPLPPPSVMTFSQHWAQSKRPCGHKLCPKMEVIYHWLSLEPVKAGKMMFVLSKDPPFPNLPQIQFLETDFEKTGLSMKYKRANMGSQAGLFERRQFANYLAICSVYIKVSHTEVDSVL